MIVGKKNATGNLALSAYGDIFQPTVTPAINATGETIIHISLRELHPPEFHPFQTNDDSEMERLVKNIKQYGVREPGLARPRPEGGYELLCGNRRKRACELAEIATLPVIIRDLNDSSAALAMVDSNLEQREKLLLSEKAWAYQVKLEALNHQGIKSDSPGQLSVDILCEQTGESKNQIFRLVRLTKLIITLLDKVDAKQLAFNPAVELSYLSQIEQAAVASAMDSYDIKPSLSQATRLKKIKLSGELMVDKINTILSEIKKPPKCEQVNSMGFRKFFPSDYSQKQMDAVITSLLKDWQAAQKQACEGNVPA